MLAQTLSSYFESKLQQQRALRVYFEAWGGAWPVHEMLDLYEASQLAFNSSVSADEALRHFEKIYNELAVYWQVFRSSRPGAVHWPPRQVFETIKREFREFSWGGPVSLLNFCEEETALNLQSALVKMREIKPNKGYPIMTVSKFLHFYNPALFPIYDNEVIWNKVCNGRFKNDFRDFCEREKFPYRRLTREDTVDFLPCYTRWANSLLSVAHDGFMQVFTDWLAKEPGTELSKRRFDVTTLYATAFEFTAIGAAMTS